MEGRYEVGEQIRNHQRTLKMVISEAEKPGCHESWFHEKSVR